MYSWVKFGFSRHNNLQKMDRFLAHGNYYNSGLHKTLHNLPVSSACSARESTS
jgi:hypothetical protein